MSGGAGWESSDGRLAPGAEWYAGVAGWKVFPCWGIAGGRCACGGVHREAKDWGKHPHGRLIGAGGDDGGYKAATNDVETVRRWWSADPEANVALACRPSGILVLDADPRHGGDASLEILEKEIGGLPATVEAVTGEYTLKGRVVRGRHVLLRVSSEVELVGKLRELPGIDIKWNGYVLIAPSRHGSGIVYQWAAGRAPWEHAIADAPAELLELLVRKSGGGGTGAGGSGYGTLDWSGEKLDVDAILEAGIPDGERMVTLYKLACAFANQYPVGTEHGRASVMRVMQEINAQRVFPPMGWGDGTEDDVKPHVARAIEFVRSNPKVTRASLSITHEMEEWAASVSAVSGSTGSGSGGGGERMLVTADGDEGGMGADPLKHDMDDNPGNDGNGATVNRSLTDKGNAARLIDYYCRSMKYTDGEGWFSWTPGTVEMHGRDGYWSSGGADGALSKAGVLAKLIVADMDRLGLNDSTDERYKHYMNWATRCKSAGAMEAAVKLWRVDDTWTRVPGRTWDSNPRLLGVQNGVVDLETGDLLAGTPEQFITRRVRTSYTPGQRNMEWEQFLDFATGGDKELQSWLQLAAGYTLTGLRTWDVLFMVFGPPGSGKSTFLDALGAVMGEYHWIIPTSVMVDNKGMSGSDEYHWAQLRGRRMVVMSEFPESKNIKEDAIKRITGDAQITARSPGEKPLMFESQAKLWVGTNHLPIIKDEAMWRRIRAIPFTQVPERPRPELRDYLRDPEGGLPAVLAWAVEGARRLLTSPHRDALGWCAAVTEASSEYRKNEDRMGLFLEEETLAVPGSEMPLPRLYTLYRDWSESRGERPMSLIAFGKQLRARGEELTGHGGRRSVVKGRQPLAGAPAVMEDWATITSLYASRRGAYGE